MRQTCIGCGCWMGSRDIDVILFGTEHSGTHRSKQKNGELIHRCRSEHFRATVSTNMGNSKHRIKHSYGNKQHHHCHHTQRHSNEQHAEKWNYKRTNYFSPACTCGRGSSCFMFKTTQMMDRRRGCGGRG